MRFYKNTSLMVGGGAASGLVVFGNVNNSGLDYVATPEMEVA